MCVDDCGAFLLDMGADGRVRTDERHSDCHYDIRYDDNDALVTFRRDESTDSISLTMRFVSEGCMLLLPERPRDGDLPVVCRKLESDAAEQATPAEEECRPDVLLPPTRA